MDYGKISETVTSIVSNILKIPEDSDLSRDSRPEWDSLNHVEIIFSLEEEFQIEFSQQDLLSLQSIKSISELVHSRVSDSTRIRIVGSGDSS